MDNIKRKFIVFALPLFVAAAQAQVVRGVVADAASGEPLGYVTIKVVEAKTGVQTNDNGEFEISNLPVGRYTIEASSVGYTPVVMQEVLVGSNKDVTLDIAIKENVNTLSNVVVRPQVSKEMPLNKMVLTGGKMLNLLQTKTPLKHIYNYKEDRVEYYKVGVALPNICYRVNF